MTITEIDSDYFCLHCGQNLRGVASDRCPECGQTFDRIKPPLQIPWESRRAASLLRRVAAFIATAWIVLRRPGKLLNLNHPAVTLHRARSFRLVVVIILFAAITLRAETWFFGFDSPGAQTALANAFQSGTFPDFSDLFQIPAIFHGAIVTLPLFLWVLTGFGPSVFASSKLDVLGRRQAVAIALYSSALLFWSVLFAWLAWYVRSFGEWDNPWFADTNSITIAFYVTAAALSLCLLLSWLAILRLLHRLTGSAARVALATGGPVAGLLVSIAVLLTIQAAILLFALMQARW